MEKVLVVGGLILVIVVSGFMAVLVGLNVLYNETAQNNVCNDAQTGLSFDVSLPGGDLTVKGSTITPDQSANARAIVDVALENGLSVRAAQIAVMTAMQESTLRILPYGYPGSTSLGLFQQIEAWGPRSVRLNARKSAYMFYFGGRQGQSGLVDIPGWESMSLGDAAQAVQQSGYPDAYDQHEGEAGAIVKAITGNIGSVSSVAVSLDECSEQLDPIEVAVRAALGRVGDEYEWDDEDGAGLVSQAFSEADITLPKDLNGLKGYKGNSDEGVKATLLPADDIKNRSSLKRGDIVFWSTDDDDTPERVGIELGDTGLNAGTNFRIATYNITVKRQFADYDQAVRNITSTYDMDIVGTQELVGDSYRKVQQLTKASGYGIYPDYRAGLRTVRHGLNGRAIIYNKKRFVLDESKTTLFRHPRYPGDRAAQIGKEEVRAGRANVPVAYFTDKVTGQPVIVVNFHNVAYARFAERRYESNLIVVEQIKQLQATYPGVPIFLAGDFNEGTGVRRPGDGANLTYQLDHRNLLYCMFASNGLMESAEALSKRQATTCPNDSIGGVDYVYLTPGIDVARGSFREIPAAQAGSDHPAKFVDVSVPGLQKRTTKWDSYAVGIRKDEVGLSAYDTRRVVGVLRLTVTTAQEIVNVGNVTGDWAAPMKKGTYSLPSSSAGQYGWRIHPIRGDRDFHNGIDLGAAEGQPVYSVGDGIIVRSYYDDCWGNLVIVDHGDVLSMYTHLLPFGAGALENMPVVAGQKIGEVGNTGSCSAGSHLHFTMGTSLDILRGEEAGSFDPGAFMREQGIVL